MKNMTLVLPDEVFERIEAEAESKCLKPMHVARLAVLEKYGSGVSAVSEDFTNHVATAGIMQPSPPAASADTAHQQEPGSPE